MCMQREIGRENIGFSAVQNWASAVTPGCTLISPQIIDLSGNNSFYFTTNLIAGNYNLLTAIGGKGRDIL